jgi:hypothetical protein
MDFIERLFGVSPDHGSGALEALYLVALLGVLAMLWRWRATAKIRIKTGMISSWRHRAKASRTRFQDE